MTQFALRMRRTAASASVSARSRNSTASINRERAPNPRGVIDHMKSVETSIGEGRHSCFPARPCPELVEGAPLSRGREGLGERTAVAVDNLSGTKDVPDLRAQV